MTAKGVTKSDRILAGKYNLKTQLSAALHLKCSLKVRYYITHNIIQLIPIQMRRHVKFEPVVAGITNI